MGVAGTVVLIVILIPIVGGAFVGIVWPDYVPTHTQRQSYHRKRHKKHHGRGHRTFLLGGVVMAARRAEHHSHKRHR